MKVQYDRNWYWFIVLLLMTVLLEGVFPGQLRAKGNGRPNAMGRFYGLPTDQDKSVHLFYLIHLPQKIDEQTKLLILLHGYGSNEEDLMGLMRQLPQNVVLVAARAPRAVGPDSFEWFEPGEEDGVAEDTLEMHSERSIMHLIQEMQSRFHIPPLQTFVAGFSQGATMSYMIGLKHSDSIGGIGVWSGLLFPWLKQTMDFASGQLKIFIGHGDADHRVDLHYARQADLWLKKRGFNPDFHVYQGMFHQIWPREMIDFDQFMSK